jgi:AraC family transcriptional regulator of adaptative response / DNA-3-methyladenine glycosylase II
MEEVKDGTYSRTFSMGEASGTLSLRQLPDESSLELRLHVPTGSALLAQLMEIVNRVGRQFDLSADPMAISAALSGRGGLGPIVRRFPGLRVPGAWDSFEFAVRAIIGQQISVAGARTLVGRLVERCGTPISSPAGSSLCFVFPTPQVILRANLDGLGITQARLDTIRRLAERASAGDPSFQPGADPEEVRESLLKIPGIGPWTAEYIAMRGLRDPDAFPASDLVIKRELGLRQLDAAPESWRPWRAYAALYLWKSYSLRKKS